MSKIPSLEKLISSLKDISVTPGNHHTLSYIPSILIRAHSSIQKVTCFSKSDLSPHPSSKKLFVLPQKCPCHLLRWHVSPKCHLPPESHFSMNYNYICSPPFANLSFVSLVCRPPNTELNRTEENFFPNTVNNNAGQLMQKRPDTVPLRPSHRHHQALHTGESQRLTVSAGSWKPSGPTT